MTSDATGPDEGSETAAHRFVRADAGGGDFAADAGLAAWLAEDPRNERSLERVELAVELGRRLAADPSSPLHAEALRAVRPSLRRRAWVQALALSGALAAGFVLAVVVVRDRVPGESAPPAIEAARRVAVEAPSTAVAVLPSGALIDASAVAVLPFAGSGDAALAAGLEDDVVASLRTVPGLYVIADEAVSPYAGTELAAPDLGGLLGARGLVDASVELVGGRVRVSARLRESATGATLWQTQIDRPVDELHAVRSEIAEHVAAAMFDASARDRVASDFRDDAPSSAKPFQQ
jgi:TolB-like protein